MAQGQPPPAMPAGWYADPYQQGQLRWWDGTSWGPHTAPGVPAPLARGARRTNGFAIASLVLGILWLYCVGSVLALVFGYRARREIRESNGQQTGGGLATAGIILGWIGVALLAVGIVALIAIALFGTDTETKFSIISPTVN